MPSVQKTRVYIRVTNEENLDRIREKTQSSSDDRRHLDMRDC